MSFTLKIVRGQFLKDADTFGKMDPYIVVQGPQGQFKTKVAHGQGTTPVWDDVFHFTNAPQLQLTAYDDDPGKDDLLGQTVINVQGLLQTGQAASWQQLFDKNMKPVGQIYIEIQPVK